MEHHSFASLLLISGLAFAVPVLASRIPGGLVPIVVAELVAGIAVGRSGFDLVESHEWLNFLSLFGFALLMFLAGLEVDVRMLAPAPRKPHGALRNAIDNPLAAGALIFAGTVSLAVGGASVLFGSRPVTHLLLIGLVLSTTSVGIVVPALKERGLTGHSLGQTILLAAVVSNFATMFLISLLAGVLASSDVWQLSLILFLFAGFFAVTTLGAHLRLSPRVRATFARLSHPTAQIDARGALALLVMFAVLAEAVRAELVLAAFLAGTAVSVVSRDESHALRAKLDAIGYGFFIPIFFITVGAKFDLAAVLASPSSALAAPLLVATAFLVKMVPALILRSRYSWRESLGAGALLSARLSLIIAASAIGHRLGVIDDATNSALILVAIATCIASPALFNALLPRGREDDASAPTAIQP